MTRADVVVVGAGPAGAACGILLAELGLEVVVLDRARFPRPKLCGEYLSPEAARILDRLGVLKTLEGLGAAPLYGMRITAPDGTVIRGAYRELDGWRPYREHALAVSRATLDAVLADRLRALPVDFRERIRVTDLLTDGAQVTGVRAVDADHRPQAFRAPLVIGADGRSSVVAQRLGCRRPHRLRRMALVTYVSGVPDCRDVGEIFVDPPDYAILNPLASNHVNMSLVVPLEHAAPWSGRLDVFFAARTKQLRHLAARVAGAERVAPVQALGPLAYRVAPPGYGGVLLVGDAAGFYDPLTGEGVFSGLRAAELAAETAAAAFRLGDWSVRTLAAYDAARRRAFSAKERFVRALHVVLGHRHVANWVAHRLARRPGVVDLLLGIIGDYVPPSALPRRIGFSLRPA